MRVADVNRLDATESLSTALIKPKPRICIISVTEDASSQYVPVMNCIFSAQKVVRDLPTRARPAPTDRRRCPPAEHSDRRVQGVRARRRVSSAGVPPHVGLVLQGRPSQRLAPVPPRESSTVQPWSERKLTSRLSLCLALKMAFLPGPMARKQLNQPTQDQVDLRAACFCHRRIIDIGYVCSVCLSSTPPPDS